MWQKVPLGWIHALPILSLQPLSTVPQRPHYLCPLRLCPSSSKEYARGLLEGHGASTGQRALTLEALAANLALQVVEVLRVGEGEGLFFHLVSSSSSHMNSG